MNALTTLDPQRRNSLLILFAAGLSFWSSMASLLPTLPLYVKEIGGTEQQVGLVMGSFAIGLLLSRRWLGRLADRRSRKIVVLVGTGVVAIAPLGYLLVTSIPLLMALRAFHGISIAAFTTGYTALVADLAPQKNRGELIGYMSLVTPIGVAIGPAMGGFLQDAFGFSALFQLASGLGVLSWLAAVQVWEPRLPKSNPETESAKVGGGRSFWSLLLSPRLRVPAFVMLLVGLVFGTITTFVPLYIQSTSIDLNPGWFYTAAAISSFTMRLVSGRASDRVGRGLFISTALLCYGISMIVLWHASSPQAFLIAALAEGAGAGIMIPTTIALMSDRSVAKERGRVFSLCIGGFDLGIAIAGPTLGSVAQYLGYANLFGLAAGFVAIALSVFLTQSSKDLPHSLRFAFGRERDVYAVENPNA